jgi:rod shape-determining protein MreD
MTHQSWTVLRRGALVIFVALILQTGVVSDLEAFSAVGDLMLIVALAAGVTGGPDRGATLGFAAGISYDLLLDTPFGLSALVYALVGYAAGMAAVYVIQPRWWFRLVVAAVGSVAAVLLTVLVGRIVGLNYPADEVFRIAAVESVWSVVLMLPACRVLQWVVGRDRAETFRVALG